MGEVRVALDPIVVFLHTLNGPGAEQVLSGEFPLLDAGDHEFGPGNRPVLEIFSAFRDLVEGRQHEPIQHLLEKQGRITANVEVERGRHLAEIETTDRLAKRAGRGLFVRSARVRRVDDIHLFDEALQCRPGSRTIGRRQGILGRARRVCRGSGRNQAAGG